MELTDREKRKRLAEYLEGKWGEISLKRGRRFSQRQWADEIDIVPANLSYYINGTRIPDGDILLKLANYFGPEIYDVLGMPRHATDNPVIRYILQNFPELSDEEQDEILNIVERATNKTNRPKPEGVQ